MVAQPQEGTTLLGSPPQLDPTAPQAGLAEGSKGVAAPRGGGNQAWEELFLLERRALLYGAKRQGRLRAAFVRREQTAAAGGWRHAPPYPNSPRFSPKPSTPGRAQRGLRAAPEDQIAAEHPLWDCFPHSHAKQPQKAKLQGANQGKAGRAATLQPPDTAPCPTTGGQILTYKQQPEEQRSTCNRITRGHSPPSCLLSHTHVSPDTLQRGCGASMRPLPPQPRRHNDGLKETHVPVIHSAPAYRWLDPVGGSQLSTLCPQSSGHHNNHSKHPQGQERPKG